MDIKCEEDTFFDLASGKMELQISEIGKVRMEWALGEVRNLVLDMLSLGCLLDIQAEMDICIWTLERYLDERHNVMVISIEIIFKAMKLEEITRRVGADREAK